MTNLNRLLQRLCDAETELTSYFTRTRTGTAGTVQSAHTPLDVPPTGCRNRPSTCRVLRLKGSPEFKLPAGGACPIGATTADRFRSSMVKDLQPWARILSIPIPISLSDSSR